MNAKRNNQRRLCWIWRAVIVVSCFLESYFLQAFELEEAKTPPSFFSGCALQSFKALQEKWPNLRLNAEALKFPLEFDCEEAAKIKSLTEPVLGVQPQLEALRNLIVRFSGGIIKESLTILKPYCQSDHKVYGNFCMALDIEAAAEISLKPNLLHLIPQSITVIGQEIARESSIDFYEVLNQGLPKEIPDRQISIAVIAGFLGLDSNALQADRLKANLIFTKRLDDYARVFPYLTQYTVFPWQERDGHSPSQDFLALLFSTRSGQARIPGLIAEQKETYKAYAGLYLGCKLAQSFKKKQLIAKEAFLVGFTYEITKLKFISVHRPRRAIQDSMRIRQKAILTGKMMQTGANFGYQICSKNPGSDDLSHLIRR